MRASKEQRSARDLQRPHHHYSPYQILSNNNTSAEICSQVAQVALQPCNDKFFTLDSSPAPSYMVHDSPSTVSILSTKSPFSPQGSSHLSDPHHSCSDNTYGSPASGSSIDDGGNLTHILRDLDMKSLGPESESDDSCSFLHNGVVHQAYWKQMMGALPDFDLKQGLIACAEAIADEDLQSAMRWISVLEPMVSVCGEPLERLGAYMLEGLRARLLSSGSIIYKKLKCREPTGPELMTYMTVLYQLCPYYKFAYNSSNMAILEAMEGEKRIHIIDFQLAQGSQWMKLLQFLSQQRSGSPPFVRVTGVDDSQSAHARGGGLDIVGQRLSKYAAELGVPFEFHGAAMDGCQVKLENLWVQPGEARAVNFPFMLHHMPDESVTTTNHRDRLLRLVKGLSPKIMTLVEQESNTNTSSFLHRCKETLDYYTAMFESIDVARPREDQQRISTEEHCVARDVVNIIACEGPERVERHEPFGKWRYRLTAAGFTQCPLSPKVTAAVLEVLEEYSKNYKAVEAEGALFLGWKNRAMCTFSAWR